MNIEKVILNRVKSDFNGEIQYVESEGVYVKYKDGKAQIGNHSKAEMARGLCLLAKEIKEGKTEFEIKEKPAFESRGIQLDLSRGGVMRVSEIKTYLEYLACMGLNTFIMYMEDVYQMKEYPYFGYMRGAYSQAELKEIDDYADALGIEVIPHIQTLGHMEQYLKWPEAGPVKCSNNVLLCDEEKTYELIECMIKTMRSAFRSNRINIGCDEAYGLELGTYLKKNGYQNGVEVMMRHVKRVVEICKKYSYEPMMYSDLLYNMCAPKKPYYVHYDTDTVITDEVKALVPEVDMIFWEYARIGEESHSKVIELHKELGRKVWYFGGFIGWWALMPAYNKFMMNSVKDAVTAAMHSGLSDVIITTWGNDGNECNKFFELLAFPIFSEICYRGDDFKLADFYDMSQFLFGVHEEFFDAAAEMALPEVIIAHQSTNFDFEMRGRALFYDDIMYNFASRIDFYKEAGEKYKNAGRVIAQSFDNEDFADYRDFGVLIYEILGKKADVMCRIRDEYKNKNKEYLKELSEKIVPELIADYKKMHELWKKMWLKTYKPFGFEYISGKLAHLIIRLEYLKEQLDSYLGGSIEVIEEFEVDFIQNESLNLSPVYTRKLMYTGTMS